MQVNGYHRNMHLCTKIQKDKQYHKEEPSEIHDGVQGEGRLGSA